MIEHGKRIKTAEVGGWYDCGKLDTLLETNEILLRKGAARRPPMPAGVDIIEPVYIEDGVRIERSVVGPNVSLEAGTVITDSAVSNMIIGKNAVLTDVRLNGGMLGDGVIVDHFEGSASLGDQSEVSGR
jgi:glucose-1-phosphate thymidylyltransferase